jgi:translation elongation factor EF-4
MRLCLLPSLRLRAHTLTPICSKRFVGMFTAKIPWAEVVIDFHDQLKNVTAGYVRLDTSEADPPLARAKLSKVDIMLNGEVVEPLAFACYKDTSQNEAGRSALGAGTRTCGPHRYRRHSCSGC